MKWVRDILLLALLGAVMVWAFETFLPDQPLQGNCGEGYIYKDGSSPYEYNGDQNICKVTIKAGSQIQGKACFGFKYPPSNQTDGCYSVGGLGSSSVRIWGGGTSNDCKAISHVEFYVCSITNTPPPPNTDTPTPIIETDTPTPKSPTATNTDLPTNTPIITQTPTPNTSTPTDTSTPIGTNTPTDSSITPTVTITPPNTLPPPSKGKTGTPKVLLPASGIDGSIDSKESWYIPIIFIVGLGLLFLSVRRKGVNSE